MARDILLGTSPRNWARNAEPAAAVSGASPGHNLALGGMALGTFLGLAFITSPWWADRRKPYHHTDFTGKKLPPLQRSVRR
jgi:hypothetical protein